MNCVTDHMVKHGGIKLQYANIVGNMLATPALTARAQHLDMSRCWDVAKCSSVGGELLYNKLATYCRIVGISSIDNVVQHFAHSSVYWSLTLNLPQAVGQVYSKVSRPSACKILDMQPTAPE